MTVSPAILVVDGDLDGRMKSSRLLRQQAYDVSSVGTFQEAIEILSLGSPPHLLITELRLGAFNGLHLVIRGRAEFPEMAAIVVTKNTDPVLEAEAKRYGAAYVLKSGDHTSFLEIISQRLGLSADRRSSIRTSIPAHMAVKIAGTSATLIDISYTGFCVELSPEAIASSLEIGLPLFGLSVKANTVWTSRVLSCPGVARCGTAVAETDASTTRGFRGFVDLLTSTFPPALGQTRRVSTHAAPSST